MGPRTLSAYLEVVAIGAVAVALSGASHAWIVSAICLAMTLGVAVAAVRRG